MHAMVDPPQNQCSYFQLLISDQYAALPLGWLLSERAKEEIKTQVGSRADSSLSWPNRWNLEGLPHWLAATRSSSGALGVTRRHDVITKFAGSVGDAIAGTDKSETIAKQINSLIEVIQRVDGFDEEHITLHVKERQFEKLHVDRG